MNNFWNLGFVLIGFFKKSLQNENKGKTFASADFVCEMCEICPEITLWAWTY